MSSYKVTYTSSGRVHEIWRGDAENASHAFSMAWAQSWHEYPEKSRYNVISNVYKKKSSTVIR